MKIIDKQALKISLIFLVLSSLWILYADKVLISLFSDPEKLTWIQTYKGWFYVLTASVIIYLLVKSEIVKTLFIETNLKIEQSKYKTLFETANDAIIIMDENNIFIDCNRKTLELFNCNRDQIVGISPIDVSPQFQVNNIESSKLAIEKINNAKNGVPQRFDWIHTTMDKTKELYTEVSFTMTLIGGSKYLFAIIRDISDQKLIELELKIKNDEYETLNEELKEKCEELQVAEEDLQASNDELAYINEELRESEERYRHISDLNHEGIFIHNQGILLDVNKAFCDIFGYKLDELLGSNIIDEIFTIKSVDKIWNNIKTENTETISLESKKKDGTIIMIEFEARNIQYQNQKARVVTVRDITERKQAENALMESEEKYKTLFLSAGDAALMFQEDKIVDCNERAVKILKASKEEILGLTLWDISPVQQPDGADSKEKTLLMINAVFNRNLIEFEWQHKNLKNELLDIDVTLSAIDVEKNVYISTWRDVTTKKNAQNALQKSEERFRTHYNNMPIPTYTWQQKENDFILVEFNTAAEIATKGSMKNLIGKKLSVIYKDKKDIITDIITCYKSKKLIQKEIFYKLNTTGDEKILDVTYVFVGPNNIVVHTDDITEQKRAENAIKESEAKYRLLVENGPSVFWITDKNGKTLYISSNISKVNGYTLEEIYKNGTKSWLDRIHKDDIENVLTNFKLIFTENKQFDVTYRIQNKKGKWIWLHDVGEKYINEDGTELVYGVLTNITFKKHTEQKVLHAMINAEERERSRIAKDLHDGVSPVLSAIKLYIQSLNDSTNDNIKNELSKKIDDTIGEAIESIKEISNNISPHILQNFGLTMAVESFVDKIRGLKQLKISVESKLTERFSIDIETALYRITAELINNTFKYAKAKSVMVKYIISDNKVLMRYVDDGVGFNLDQVWKNKIGMGIFNMKNRIRSLNGQFNIISEPDKGISVDISVPINE